jgi:hypothetical protein
LELSRHFDRNENEDGCVFTSIFFSHRDTLLDGQHDIYMERNDRKHNKIITPGSTEDKEIDQIFRVIRKLRLDLHGYTPEEIK